MVEQTRTEVSRDLGLFTITMVGVGAMIGFPGSERRILVDKWDQYIFCCFFSYNRIV